MRLDKFLANNTGFSRRDVAKLTKQQRVTVDGVLAKNPAQPVDERSCVAIDGARVSQLGHLYLMLNKPQGYVCVTENAEHPTVLDLLYSAPTVSPALKDKLQIAGRLDIDTTGLVLITTDGDWNHQITTPGKACGKQYMVDTEQPISVDTIAAIRNGMQLRNDPKPTKPADIEILAPCRARLTLFEGRYHQVKRMFAACGNHVLKLHRTAIANIVLDPLLAPGESRPLTPQEQRFS